MVLYHKEFEKAGKSAGLQIWTIESMELVLVPDNLHGNFNDGDAYVILHTVKQRDSCFYDLHFWLGKECKQAKSTAAAIFTVQMHDYLGRKPVQYRELQGVESTTFTRYFKGSTTYKEVSSSVSHHLITSSCQSSSSSSFNQSEEGPPAIPAVPFLTPPFSVSHTLLVVGCAIALYALYALVGSISADK